MKLLLATKNKNKIKEITNSLKNTDFEILTLEDFPDIPDVIEDGMTLEENSLKKAKEFYEFTHILTLADDTGLEVEALNGAPGVYSARYAGENCSYDDNNKKMIAALKGKENRNAHFKTIITLYGKNGVIKQVEGVLNGSIIDNYRGVNGFGYDPIFLAENSNRTLAEIGLNEKNKISHRGKAISEMSKFIIEKFSEYFI